MVKGKKGHSEERTYTADYGLAVLTISAFSLIVLFAILSTDSFKLDAWALIGLVVFLVYIYLMAGMPKKIIFKHDRISVFEPFRRKKLFEIPYGNIKLVTLGSASATIPKAGYPRRFVFTIFQKNGGEAHIFLSFLSGGSAAEIEQEFIFRIGKEKYEDKLDKE
jgi:hypothetical protein